MAPNITNNVNIQYNPEFLAVLEDLRTMMKNFINFSTTQWELAFNKWETIATKIEEGDTRLSEELKLYFEQLNSRLNLSDERDNARYQDLITRLVRLEGKVDWAAEEITKAKNEAIAARKQAEKNGQKLDAIDAKLAIIHANVLIAVRQGEISLQNQSTMMGTLADLEAAVGGVKAMSELILVYAKTSATNTAEILVLNQSMAQRLRQIGEDVNRYGERSLAEFQAIRFTQAEHTQYFLTLIRYAQNAELMHTKIINEVLQNRHMQGADAAAITTLINTFRSEFADYRQWAIRHAADQKAFFEKMEVKINGLDVKLDVNQAANVAYFKTIIDLIKANEAADAARDAKILANIMIVIENTNDLEDLCRRQSTVVNNYNYNYQTVVNNVITNHCHTYEHEWQRYNCLQACTRTCATPAWCPPNSCVSLRNCWNSCNWSNQPWRNQCDRQIRERGCN